jgi:hypothetical protein
MIVAHAEERIVELRFASSYISPRHFFKATIPAMLHTSRCSRTEALRYYKPLDNEKSANGAYINSCVDYLYIRESRPPGPWDLPPYYDDGCAEQVKLVMPLLPFKNRYVLFAFLSLVQLYFFKKAMPSPFECPQRLLLFALRSPLP